MIIKKKYWSIHSQEKGKWHNKSQDLNSDSSNAQSNDLSQDTSL